MGRQNAGIPLPASLAEATSDVKVRTSFPSYFEQVQGASDRDRAKEALGALSHPRYINFFPLKSGTCGWGGRRTLVLPYSTPWFCFAPPSEGSKLGFLFGVKSPRKRRINPPIHLRGPDEWPRNRRLLSSRRCRRGDEWQ